MLCCVHTQGRPLSEWKLRKSGWGGGRWEEGVKGTGGEEEGEIVVSM